MKLAALGMCVLNGAHSKSIKSANIQVNTGIFVVQAWLGRLCMLQKNKNTCSLQHSVLLKVCCLI